MPVQMIEVHEDADGQRLDRWLRRIFPDLGQGRIEKMCRKGELRIDGARAKASTRVEAGQVVRVPPIEARAARPTKAFEITDEDRAKMAAMVLYRDDDIIALNKPAGLPVQGGSNQQVHIDGLSAALVPEGTPRPKLVHRLDKDTSGVLLLALNGKAAAGLARSFQDRSTRKIYWAAVAGVPKPRRGIIRFGLVKAPGHGPHGAGEKMHCIHPNRVAETDGAKHATSDYAVLDNLGTRVTWAALVPITGRTHQLRAHMAEIGHPIVGDGKYGGNAQVNAGDGWGAQLGGDISRKLHLHARSLKISHPVNGAEMTFTAPLAPHMQKTWDMLGWNVADVPTDPFEEDLA